MEGTNYLHNQVTDISRTYRNELKEKPFQSYFYEEGTRPRAEGPFQRDFSRIMYSSSFRRLQGKMQLLGIREDQFFRNRLTHSLEVSQIARSIAFELNYDVSEIYVVEAGALAHDLGNPPFGHAGEKKLNSLFKEIGGFEGNAQTFRILTKIERKKPDFCGLNLTYRTLLSIVKYYKKYDVNYKGDKKQKFIYDNDYDMIEKFLTENKFKVRTLDVQIVDLADEIAYAAHDLEDGLRLKSYTIDEILHDFYTAYADKDMQAYNKLKEIVDECRDSKNYKGLDSSDYTKLFRQELTSRIINLLIHDIGLIDLEQEYKDETGTMWNQELGFMNYGSIANGLKKITFKCINHNDDVFNYEQNGDKILEYLTEVYENTPMHLPPEYRSEEYLKAMSKGDKEYIETEKKLQDRLICDYIAGMMDSYAVSTYNKFKKNES